MVMKVAIVGSRSFNDYSLVEKTLNPVRESIDMFVSGGASGADTLAQKYAKDKGLPILIYYPDWKTYGRNAAYYRNRKIVEECDVVIAFWDGESKGTQHSFKLAEEFNKRIKVIKYNEL